MIEEHNHRIFLSLLKETFLLHLLVVAVWFFIYKLYRHDVRHGRFIFFMNVLVYISCVSCLINDLNTYPNLSAGGVGFAFEMGILALSIVATFLLVVEYFIIKLIIRAFSPNKTHNS